MSKPFKILLAEDGLNFFEFFFYLIIQIHFKN